MGSIRWPWRGHCVKVAVLNRSKEVRSTKQIISCVIIFVAGFLTGVFFAAWKLDSKSTASVVKTAPPVEQTGSDEIQNRIAGIERMLKQNPQNLEALIQLGNDYFDTGNHQQAVEAYQKALVIDPRNPDVMTDMGISYRRLKKPEQSAETFRKALEIDPNHVIALFNLGIVLRDDLKDYPGAIEAWESFIQKAGDSPHAVMVRPWLKALKEQTSGTAKTGDGK